MARSRAVTPPRQKPRTTIGIQGARVHNLKNISLEIPRDALVVVTGLSGSGKSSLAFDTIYAEGQRRYMESLSTFAKRFVAQVAKPDVDFVFGLSPVISIEQKTIASNPRSTVGTMTDISSYLNLLFATIGEPHCPRTGEVVPSRTTSQILEAVLSLPEGAEIELRAPIFKVYGEDLNFVFTEVRKKGCRRLIVDGTLRRHLRLRRARSGRRRGPGRQRRCSRQRRHQHRRHRRSLHRRAEAREVDQGGHCQRPARGRRAGAAARREGREQERSRTLLPRPLQPERALHLRRHRAGVLSVQQPRERVPDVRRAGRRQGHAPGTAGPGSAAQHSGRLFRARGVPLQPRQLERPDDVQPGGSAGLPARFPLEPAAGEGAPRDPLRHRAAAHPDPHAS